VAHEQAAFSNPALGTSFAGSLMAMSSQRLAFSIILIERGKHPCFVVGESATSLANLLLAAAAWTLRKWLRAAALFWLQILRAFFASMHFRFCSASL
jgi:hypothetical protein